MHTEVFKYLIEVDKLRSISKASNALYISRTALSESISQFEKELNVVIFERNKNGVTTTIAGKKIIEQAKCILDDIDKLYQISNEFPAKTNYTEILTFGINEKFSHSGILNKAINIAMQKHPELSFNAINVNSQACVLAVAQGELDFAIVGFDKENEVRALDGLQQLSLRHIVLPADPVYVLCNKQSPLHNRNLLTSADLKNETLVTYSTISSTTASSIDEVLHQRVIFLPNLDGILQTVKDNIGITLLPLTLLTQAKEKIDESLAVIPLAGEFQFNCIIYPDKNKLTPAQEFFISVYEQCFKEYYA